MEYLFYIDITLCLQFVVIAIFLWVQKKGQRTANIFLALFYISLSLTTLSFSQYFFEKPIIPHLLKIHYPLEYAIAPLLYFYLKAVLEPDFRFKKVNLLHFIPSLIFFFRDFLYYFKSADEKIILHTDKLEIYHYYLASLFYLQFVVYFYMILKKLLLYNQQLKVIDDYSQAIKRWIQEFITVSIIVLTLNIIPIFINPRLMLLIPLISSILYFLILYKIFFEPQVFVYLKSSEQIISDITKYPNTEISKELEKILNEKLRDSIVINKIYTDPNLTLPGLAKMFQIPYHQLSRFINEKYNQNFNDYINSKRVDDVKKRLINEKYNHLTIEAIGKSVGFNSKTAFYTAFKKNTNCSPNQYKKAHLEKLAV